MMRYRLRSKENRPVVRVTRASLKRNTNLPMYTSKNLNFAVPRFNVQSGNLQQNAQRPKVPQSRNRREKSAGKGCGRKAKYGKGKENKKPKGCFKEIKPADYYKLLKTSRNDKCLQETSKSLFRQICETYDKEFCAPSRAKPPINANFCTNRLRKSKPFDTKRHLRQKILSEVERINRLLGGHPITDMPLPTHDVHTPEDDHTRPERDRELIPASKWVYATPEKQKIKHFSYENEKSQVKAALVHTTSKNKTLYELRDGTSRWIDFQQLGGSNRAPVDLRCLRPVLQFERVGSGGSLVPDEFVDVTFQAVSSPLQREVVVGDKGFEFNPFAACSQRPKKTRVVERSQQGGRRTISFGDEQGFQLKLGEDGEFRASSRFLEGDSSEGGVFPTTTSQKSGFFDLDSCFH